jgi:hypothetical protein
MHVYLLSFVLSASPVAPVRLGGTELEVALEKEGGGEGRREGGGGEGGRGEGGGGGGGGDVYLVGEFSAIFSSSFPSFPSHTTQCCFVICSK